MTSDDACGGNDKCASDGKSFQREEFSASGGPPRRRSSADAGAELHRVVRANDRDFNAQFSYADNYIKTSKYNLFTFLPLNLFEQFRRLANFYFLVLMCLQFIPQISSVAWYSTAVPLLFVLFVSAVKDGYDDVQRHKNDNQVNNRVSYIVRNGRLEEEQWMNVKNGHFIAADLFLLSSSEPYGLCYIETAELDGETNLKCRCALPETSEMGDIVADIAAFGGQILCEPPNNQLHSFEGQLAYKGREFALDNSRMLLRGCRLRNTRWCYGLVVFAGRDTKLMMNSGKTTLKRTSLDRFLNVLILGIVLFLFAMCFICMILSFTWEYVTGRSFTAYIEWDEIAYKGGDRDLLVIAGLSFLEFFSYIILLNTVVPISLYISVEVLRFCHSLWINFDRKMYYEKTDTPAHARTTTLNEELGQVKYIFSDKTGTLTQNIMLFKKCSINGKFYGDLLNSRNEIVDVDEKSTPSLDFSANRWNEPAFKFYDKTLMDDTNAGVFEVHEFWRLLAICHTVMPERKSGSLLEYQAQSPDEAALTSAARNFGFVFKSRTPQSITIEVNGKQEVYEMIHILDFDNVRKRMSVIVRAQSHDNNNNQPIKLYCKGADTMILDRLNQSEPGAELFKQITLQHLDKFAADGLRTLCLAYRTVDEEYCNDWMERQRQASLDVVNKSQRLEELYEEIERNLTLIGATAIEDKLQDGVPQAIATLTQANIKIWVLTGDKTETAINIGYSCRLLTEEMREVFVIDGETEREVEVQMKDVRRQIERANQRCRNGGTDIQHDVDSSKEQFTVFDEKFTMKRRRDSTNSSASSLTHFLDDKSPYTIKKQPWYRKVTNWVFSPLRYLFVPIHWLTAPLRWIWRLGAVTHGGSQFYRPTPPTEMSANVTRYIEQQIDMLRQIETKEEAENLKQQKSKEENEKSKKERIAENEQSMGSARNIGSSAVSENIRSFEATVTACRRVSDIPEAVNMSVASVHTAIQNGRSRRRFTPRRTSAGDPRSGPPPIPAGLNPRIRRRSVFDDEIREPQLQVLNRSLHDRRLRAQTSKQSTLNSRSEPISVVSDAFIEEGGCEDRIRNAQVADELVDVEDHNILTSSDTFALVINGGSLVHALSRHYEKLFLEIACMCTAVICCRVTPLQKAKVVDLVKRHVKAVTLAIGDGANDVSMIKTAHIGVGISGQEGMQAVLSSDFSIGQFRYLERLLLVHGRWSYLRMSKFLRYFFYKNFSYTLTHFWYSFFCGYSAQTMYNPLLMACFNMFFTAFPVLAMGVFDQDVNDEYSLRYPRLYIPGQNNQYFNMRIFVYSAIHGGVSSVVLFFVPYGAYKWTSDAYGRDIGDYALLSFTVFTALVIVVNGQIMFDTIYWTIYNHLYLWGSLLIYVIIVVLVHQVTPLLHTKFIALISQEVVASYDVARHAVCLPNFWFVLLLICVMLLVPVLANRFFWFDTRPSYADQLRVLYRMYPHEKRRPAAGERVGTAASKQSTVPTRRSRRGSLRSGYAFSQASGFGELIAKGTLFRNIEQLRIPSFKHANSSKSGGSKASKTKEKESTEYSTEPENLSPTKSGGILSSLKQSLRHHLPGAESPSKRDSQESAAQIQSESKRKRADRIQPIEQQHQHNKQQQQHINNQREQQVSEQLANLQLTPRMTARHRFLVNVDNEPLPSDWPLTCQDSKDSSRSPGVSSTDDSSLSSESATSNNTIPLSTATTTTVVTVPNTGVGDRPRLPSYHTFMATRNRRAKKVSPIRENSNSRDEDY